MDYAKIALETIEAVRWAIRKEDEEFGGEVLAEKLHGALTEAGVPLVDDAWYGAPDEVFIGLVLAFLDQDGFDNLEDPAVVRIQYDLSNALMDKGHLEETHSEFWERATGAL